MILERFTDAGNNTRAGIRLDEVDTRALRTLSPEDREDYLAQVGFDLGVMVGDAVDFYGGPEAAMSEISDALKDYRPIAATHLSSADRIVLESAALDAVDLMTNPVTGGARL